MARPERNTVDYFPKWNPSRKLLNTLQDYIDGKEAFKKFRSSCSAFIKKESVRTFVFKNNDKCIICFSKENLQIDHIKSVYRCFLDGNFYFCNTQKNLQVLCRKCNTSKLP